MVIDLTDDVMSTLRAHRTQATQLDELDQSFWDGLAELANLHRPIAYDVGTSGLLRCSECAKGTLNRVWPCQTLRILAASINVKAKV